MPASINTNTTRPQSGQNLSGSATPRNQREQTADSSDTIGRSRSNTPQAARAGVQPRDAALFWACCGGKGASGCCPSSGTHLAALHDECADCQHRRCNACRTFDVPGHASDMIIN